MIQRIQTIYLLIVVILGISLYFCPVLQFTSNIDDGVQRMFELSATGLEEQTEEYSYIADELPPVVFNDTWGLGLSTLIMPALALIIIFLYKKRKLQARLSLLLFMFCLGYYGVLLIYAWFGKHNIAPDWAVLPSSCLPLINAVFSLMATRRILKDEALVRAADRLR